MDRRTRDYTVFAMRRAIVEIVARFPVYRSYPRRRTGAGRPAPHRRVVEAAKRVSALPDRTVHDLVAATLLGQVETEGPDGPTRTSCAASAGGFSNSPGR
jgi:(1->4)-alpha-D-glucan 1-alpha-D-glucosylmutase